MIDKIRKYVSRRLFLYISALDLDFDDGIAGNYTESIAMTASVVVLAIIGLWALQPFLQGPDVSVVAFVVIFLVCAWVAMTFIVSTRDRIPLHLNLVSFWILITCLIVVIVRAVLPPPEHGAAERFLYAFFILAILVPIHVWRCKIRRYYRKLLYVVLILGGHGVGIGIFAAQP